MKRLPITPRPDWEKKVEAQGLVYHSPEAVFWNESACYEFGPQEIDTIEAATDELYRLCLAATGRVIEENLFSRLRIPDRALPLIRSSWEREDLSLYGRFDLHYDGSGPPKMYEFNADTPTALLEAAVIQWQWLEETRPGGDQFNSIHEKLLARWAESGVSGRFHFACAKGSAEDLATTVYLQDTALQSGLQTTFLYMDEIGWDGRRSVDLAGEPIERIFKLYPWDWWIGESFGQHLPLAPWRVAEPAWKMIPSNKGILPILWEMFPGHPNLLPAFETPGPLAGNFARKPLRGREGANITLGTNGAEVSTPGEYADDGFIYQKLLVPPRLDGVFPVIGSWIVQDKAAGIGIRESSSPITGNTSSFVPHYLSQ